MALSYIPSATANAGPDTIICVTESYPITAQIDHATSIHWSSSGTGTFDDATIATPIYTPDLQALPDGGDTLTVTVDNAACDPSTDSFFLAIQPEPIAHLSTHDTSFCVDDNAPVIAIQLSGNYHQYSTNISWHAIDENGNDGDGTFSDISIDNPVYTFSGQDILNQEIYLVFSAFALGPCDTPAHDTLHVSFYYKPMAYAGQDGEICEGDTIHLNGQAQYYESVYWFRIPNTGDIGTFTNNGTLEASYFPSEEDFENGEVGFQLDAYSPGNVCNTDMDTVHYNITRQSTAHAGDDFAICRDGIIELQGEAEYHSGIQWDALTTGALSGDGNWQDQNNTILNPVYTPSLGDIAAGEVHFVLSAWAMAPCDQPARDTIVVTLNDYPSASVGEDINICSSEPVILEAEADNFSSVNWTTSGSGSFSQQDLTSVYTFSEQDIESGIITITFTAQPKYPCDVPATDSLQVIIKPAPVIDLPDIVEAAYNMPFTFYPDVSGASGNYSFDWQPDSLFTNPNVRDASTYPFPYPGLSEYLVWLTVTDESNECATTDSVAVEVILGEVQIDLQAEPDYVCQNGSAILYANATGGTGIYEYYWQASPPDPEMAPFDSAVIITPEETTIYKITVNDGFSSPSSEIEITLQPNPDTPAIEGAETTETYQKEIYTTEGSDLAYYDWWARNGSVVAGQGTKEVTIEWGAPGNGTVYLQMASQYGCFGDTSLLNVSISTTGIETLEGVDDLKIYPNPANQMVHIFYELKQDKDLWFSIFNPVGQVVYMTGKQSQSVGRQQMTLPLEGLTNGMYIIRIKSDSRQIHYRIMKQ
jgi:hypothetical protein